MAQGTNAAAYQRLRPLENTNTGSIVEEHIRYWKKYKDKEEADKLAMEAKKRLYESQIAEKYDKAITEMSPSDVNRFYQDQVISTLEANKDEIADLAKRKTEGDATAIMPYNAKKQQFADMAKMGNAIGGKLAELTKIKQSGDYNKVLDEPLAEMIDAMNSGMFAIDKKTLKHRIYSKDGKRVLFDGSSEELTNAFLSTGFNKPVNYLATGELISKSIKLPEVNGNVQWTPEATRSAIISTASALNNDPNLMETYKKENGINKPTQEMSPVEINTLATKFTDEFVVKGVVTKDNSLANENVKSSIYKRNFDIANTNEEKQNKLNELPTLKLATTTTGEPLVENEITQSKGQPVSAKKSNTVWNNVLINNGGAVVTEAGNKKTTLTVKILKISDKGDVKMIGQQLTRTPIYRDGYVVREDDVVTQKDITDKKDQGLVAIATYSEKLGRNYESLTEMVNEAKGLIGTPSKAFDAEAFYKNRKNQK